MDAAILHNGATGTVINVIEVRSLYDWPGAVDLPAGMGIGWIFDGTDWSPPVEATPHVPVQPTIGELLQRVEELQSALKALLETQSENP